MSCSRGLLLLFFLPALGGCAHLAQVEEGIRWHGLAGAWRSENKDYLLIGCSGAFNIDQTDAAAPIPWSHHESGAHISEVTASGFTVSHFPLAGSHYSVQEWPHAEGGETVMRAEELRWVRTKALDCR